MLLGILGVGDLLEAIAGLAVRALNAIVAAVGGALAAAIGLLPEMPALPDPPAALLTAEAWVAWAFPVGTLLDCLAFALAMYVLWFGVAIALRWAKAQDS